MRISRQNAPRRVTMMAIFALPAFAAATLLPSLSQAAPAPKATAQNAKAQRVTAALTKFLRRKLTSPNGSLRVVVKPSARADAGYFSEVAIYGKPALLKKKMPITELQMRATNVHISPSMILLPKNRDLVTLAATTSLRVVISEDDLTQMFANGKSTRSMKLKAKFLGDRLRIVGNLKLGWITGPVVATGKVRVGADHMIYIDLLTLQLNGVEAPAALPHDLHRPADAAIERRGSARRAEIQFQRPVESADFRQRSAVSPDLQAAQIRRLAHHHHRRLKKCEYSQMQKERTEKIRALF